MAKLIGVTDVSETIKYDGKTYRRSTEPAEGGDIVRHDAPGYSFAPKGSFFRVFTDSDGNSIIVDEDGDKYKVSNDADFSVFKPDNSENPRQYIEVDRTAKVGDRIRIVNAEHTYGKYSNGDEFVVTKEPEFYGDVYVSEAETLGNASGLILRDEYVVLEPVGSKFSPGDDVILLSGGGSHPLHGFENGKIYKVLQTGYPHPLGTLIAISRTDGGHTGFARPDQLEKLEQFKSRTQR